ncbi:heat shock protein 70 kDa [Trifolium pratense]|uniref:Heat shock protein 70 kDa n=1 Tax=Trifolium pratense TaxID=57577 RepID=A0A2K3L4Y2_TRIPR|nr:heat shock protein 70 kDa [Trifolium pratense]PNX80582.1 heat shock protein 70 kDa [Trifolium pratense]
MFFPDEIPPETKEKIIEECNKAEKWLRDKRQHQDALPKCADPVFWSRDIDSRTRELNFSVHLMQLVLSNSGYHGAIA